jgi:hypothetical protein
MLALLKIENLKSGSGCPDPYGLPSEERGIRNGEEKSGRNNWSQDLQAVEGTY